MRWQELLRVFSSAFCPYWLWDSESLISNWYRGLFSQR